MAAQAPCFCSAASAQARMQHTRLRRVTHASGIRIALLPVGPGQHASLHRRATVPAAAPDWHRIAASDDEEGQGDVAGYPLPSLLDRDEDKEEARGHFRTVFDFPRWASHRSTRRYVRHMSGMLSSRIVRALAAPMLYTFGLSMTVATAHQLAEVGQLPTPWPALQLHTEPFALTSFALALLLVFRTNASYARWLDARKSWGLVTNRSRDLTRQALTWMPEGGAGTVLQSMLCRWTVAFAVALKCHVREGEDPGRELQGVLPPDELAALLAARDRPSYVISVLSHIVREGMVASPSASSSPSASAAAISATANMDLNLTTLGDVVGTCERIIKTPIPLSYTRHTSRFMIIWLSLLPFSLWEPCHWSLVPACVLISFLLLGIEEIGVQIEEPFSILPLEQMCAGIRRDVEGMQQLGGGGGGGVAAAALVHSVAAVQAGHGNGRGSNGASKGSVLNS